MFLVLLIKYSIIINIFRQLALLLPVMWSLSSIMGMNGVWYEFIAAEVLTCVYCGYVYKKNPIRFEAKGEENGTGQQDGNQPHDAAHL